MSIASIVFDVVNTEYFEDLSDDLLSMIGLFNADNIRDAVTETQAEALKVIMQRIEQRELELSSKNPMVKLHD